MEDQQHRVRLPGLQRLRAVRGLEMTSPNHSGNGFGWDQVDPMDENDIHLWMKLEHLGHYLFAADFLKPYKPQLVADISCGIGYGLPELKRIAGAVVRRR